MREILFRGKCVDNGEWVEGFYHESKISGCFILVPKLKVRKRDGVVIGDSFDVYKIIPETVGQYTGLTDKNSKKIFEGDIVFYEYEYVSGVINWDKQSARLIIDFDTWCTDFDSVFGGEIEVVGNIHDNPEQLEVQT